VVVPGFHFGMGGGAKVQKVSKLAKHSVKQRKTGRLGGGANAPFALLHHCNVFTFSILTL